MREPTKRSEELSQHIIFRSFFSLAMALRLLLVVFVPFGQRVEHRLEGLNDEPAHFNYVKFLAAHHSLPIQRGTVKDPGAFERNDFEYYQPPLYYIIGAFFFATFGERNAFYCCRLFSCLCGILTVFLISSIVYKSAPDQLLRHYALLFAALFPTHAYFCAMISNDALSWLFATLIVYEVIAIGAPQSILHLSWKRSMRLIFYLAAGMLTKSSMAISFFVIAAYFFIGSIGTRKPSTALQGCGIVGIAAIVAFPWYFRNLLIYHSLFALNMGFGQPSHCLSTLQAITGFIEKTIHYFWFPMQHGAPGRVGTKICNIIGGAILVVQGIAAAEYLLRTKQPSFEVMLLTFVLILTTAFYISLNASHSEPEGRFLLPGFSAIVFFFGAPAVGLFNRIGRQHCALWAAIVSSMYPYLFLFFTKAA